MSGLFSTPRLRPVSVPEKISPEETERAAKEAAEREAERIRKRKAAQSTILTGPAGIVTKPTVLKEKLGE